MRYEYLLTYQDFKNAQILYRKRNWLSSLSYYFWIWTVPIFIVAIVILAAISSASGGDVNMTNVGRSLAPVLVFAALVPALRFFQFRTCWKRLVPESTPDRSTKSVIRVAIEFTDEQLISILPGRSEGRFFWPALNGFAEDERIALIFIKKKQFIFIPRTALPVEAWAEISSRILNMKASS